MICIVVDGLLWLWLRLCLWLWLVGVCCGCGCGWLLVVGTLPSRGRVCRVCSPSPLSTLVPFSRPSAAPSAPVSCGVCPTPFNSDSASDSDGGWLACGWHACRLILAPLPPHTTNLQSTNKTAPHPPCLQPPTHKPPLRPPGGPEDHRPRGSTLLSWSPSRTDYTSKPRRNQDQYQYRYQPTKPTDQTNNRQQGGRRDAVGRLLFSSTPRAVLWGVLCADVRQSAMLLGLCWSLRMH